jgi:phospholipid-translocating ATPase
VPEAISQLQRMGLNVWMITGDKVETAIAISKICGLIKAGTSDVQRVSNLKGAKLR